MVIRPLKKTYLQQFEYAPSNFYWEFLSFYDTVYFNAY